MKVKDLIWKLQQVYDKDKRVSFGNVGEGASKKAICDIVEKEFEVVLIN